MRALQHASQFLTSDLGLIWDPAIVSFSLSPVQLFPVPCHLPGLGTDGGMGS